MHIVLMGPPGAGKGTQAKIISEKLHIPHISTGDIFRSNVGAGTTLGNEAKKYLDAGEYVPDSITNGMVRDRLAQADAINGFLLDGYPRTLNQIHELDSMLKSLGQTLDLVIEIVADTDVVVQRLTARAAQEGRSDDGADVMRHRLDVYAEQTAPITKVYGERGLVRQVDGIGTVADVTDRIMAHL